MKDIIIEAGRRLGKYLRTELDGRVTEVNVKRLCAVATDILPGERYEAARNMLSFCARYGILIDLATTGESERLKVNNAIYTLTTRALMADGFARMAVALLLVILDSGEAEVRRAERLMAGELVSELFSAEVTQAQADIPKEVVIPPEFRVKDRVLLEYLGAAETVHIPVGICEIGEKAFASNNKIKSVNLPDGVVKIGNHAFDGCTSLGRASLPDSLEEIGAYAFYDCRKLGILNFPRGLSKLGAYAFAECNRLKAADIPRGVTYIPLGAFSRSGLAELALPSTLKEIDDSAFFGTKIKTVDLPEALQKMGEKAFFSCCSLKEVAVPGSIGELPSSAFSMCFSLKKITLEEGIRSIGERALSGCISLSGIDLPSSVKYIGAYAFENCRSLSEIRLHGTLGSCSADAYSGCFARVIEKSM